MFFDQAGDQAALFGLRDEIPQKGGGGGAQVTVTVRHLTGAADAVSAGARSTVRQFKAAVQQAAAARGGNCPAADQRSDA